MFCVCDLFATPLTTLGYFLPLWCHLPAHCEILVHWPRLDSCGQSVCPLTYVKPASIPGPPQWHLAQSRGAPAPALSREASVWLCWLIWNSALKYILLGSESSVPCLWQEFSSGEGDGSTVKSACYAQRTPHTKTRPLLTTETQGRS